MPDDDYEYFSPNEKVRIQSEVLRYKLDKSETRRASREVRDALEREAKANNR